MSGPIISGFTILTSLLRDATVLPNSLWQLSSVAWGSVPAAKVRKAITDHAENGYTAFGMFFPLLISTRLSDDTG